MFCEGEQAHARLGLTIGRSPAGQGFPQFGKVTTPTLIVSGSEDTNVPIFEAHLLERALDTRRIPHTLLIFPGEGHSFDKNPWHAKIAAREELKWLEKYGRKSP